MAKVIARIRGGLGNQLFCYAAARRLALVNSAELVLDDTTGFVRDHQYQRRYALDRFSITARKANPAERLEPCERLRRGAAKAISRRMPFARRAYLEQEGVDFDPRLLEYPVRGTVYLDGYWQSEKYFKDIEPVIRRDLSIIPPEDDCNRAIAERIRSSDAVCVHVRCFSRADAKHLGHEYNDLQANYYQQALEEIRHQVQSPRYFVFSDYIGTVLEVLALSEDVVCVDQNQGDDNAYADLWLMTQCKHFIIANSTFSWWGAWLAESPGKTVIAPGGLGTPAAAWGFEGLLPETWITIP